MLAVAHLSQPAAGAWHALRLSMEGATLKGFVDGKLVLTATDALYPRGMAGLLSGADDHAMHMPFFDSFAVTPVNTPRSSAATSLSKATPIYGR